MLTLLGSSPTAEATSAGQIITGTIGAAATYLALRLFATVVLEVKNGYKVDATAGSLILGGGGILLLRNAIWSKEKEQSNE